MQPTDDRFDDASHKFLQDVKKGKPRKFVMIKDGVQINKLIVFKVGTFDRVLRKAKQDGTRGETYWGLLRGDGTDIRFELSRTDGFVAPPGTDIRLKDFLREVTGLKLEPTYTIVEKLADVDDEDANEVIGDFRETERVAEQPDEDAGAKFSRLLQALTPHANRALSMNTTIRGELQAGIQEAEDLGRRSDFEAGLSALRRVGELIRCCCAEAGIATGSEEPNNVAAPAETSSETRRREWDLRLAEIEPRYRESVRTGGPLAEQLQKVMQYAQTQAGNQQFIKALVGLDRVERMLGD
jgi:hypothetical protein